MENSTPSQLMRGSIMDRFQKRRTVDQATHALERAASRLIELEEESFDSDPDLTEMLSNIIAGIFPLLDNLAVVRQTTYARRRCRALRKSHPKYKVYQWRYQPHRGRSAGVNPTDTHPSAERGGGSCSRQ